MTDRHGHAARRSRRGSVALLAAFTILLMFGFAALVVDIGNLYRVRRELQNASDSAALAGAQRLDGSQAGIDAAIQQAKDFALANDANGFEVTLEDDDISVGNWNTGTSVFTELSKTPANPAQVNAVRVISRRSEATSNPVGHRFARVFGNTDSDVSATATAVGGGSVTECGFPLAVAECALFEPLPSGACQYCMRFSADGDDTAGWANLDPNRGGGDASPAAAPHLADIIEDACFSGGTGVGDVVVDGDTRECAAGVCTNAVAGSGINVNNGNFMNTGANSPCTRIETILQRTGVTDTDDTDGIHYFSVRVPVLDEDDCEDPSFANNNRQIEGWATLDIFGIKCGNSSAAVIDADFEVPSDEEGLCTDGVPGDKYMLGSLRCGIESHSPAGGGFFGVDAITRLVQ